MINLCRKRLAESVPKAKSHVCAVCQGPAQQVVSQNDPVGYAGMQSPSIVFLRVPPRCRDACNLVGAFHSRETFPLRQHVEV